MYDALIERVGTNIMSHMHDNANERRVGGGTMQTMFSLMNLIKKNIPQLFVYLCGWYKLINLSKSILI